MDGLQCARDVAWNAAKDTVVGTNNVRFHPVFAVRLNSERDGSKRPKVGQPTYRSSANLVAEFHKPIRRFVPSLLKSNCETPLIVRFGKVTDHGKMRGKA